MARESFNRLPLIAAAAVLTAAGLALPAHAEALVDGSDSPQIQAGQVVDGSAYLGGNNVSVAGTVQGDLYCAGNTVTITGVVEGDVLCAANTLTVSGRVNGDVRLAGNAVNLGGATAGSATLVGQSITTAGASTIGGDLTVGGSLIDLAGNVGRDVRAGATNATIAGTVGRNVDGELANLTVAEGAKITGNLRYVSDKDATVAPGSVQGDIQRTTPPPPPQRSTPTSPSFGTWAVFALFWIAGFVVLSLLVALVLPRYVRSTTAPHGRGLGKALLVGLLTVLAAGPAVVILFLTFVGAIAALLLHAAVTVGLMVGAILSAHFLGRAVLHNRATNVVGSTALGAAMLAVVGVVPVAGPIIVFLAACAGLGMIVLGLRSQQEPREVAAYPGPTAAPAPYLAPAAAPGPYHPGPTQSAPTTDHPTQSLPAQEGPREDGPKQVLPPQDRPGDDTGRPE